LDVVEGFCQQISFRLDGLLKAARCAAPKGIESWAVIGREIRKGF